jgi:hypothetical protein
MKITYQTATIASSGTTSGAVSTGIIGTENTQLMGLEFPAAMTGTSMTFTGSRSSDGTYVTITEVGGASNYTVTVSAGKFVPVEPRVFATFPFIKLVSGSAEGAERSIIIHSRPVL